MGTLLFMKALKILIFLFLFAFTTHAFAKSNSYYQAVLTNILSNCKTIECKKQIFEQEAHTAFFKQIDTALNQARFKLSQWGKRELWSKSY